MFRALSNPAPARRARTRATSLAAAGLGCALLVLATALPAAGEISERLSAPGLVFEFDSRDRARAEVLWPLMVADRKEIMERLRLFPAATLRVILAPDRAAFAALVGAEMAESSLGVYMLGRATIVLRSPRGAAGGAWDPRVVMRHELAHGLIDLAISQPVPLWMHEGLAILISNEMSYLDEGRLTLRAVANRLIPLPVLMHRFPRSHGQRGHAYAQAASFIRFLLRREGMNGLQRLLSSLEDGLQPPEAFFFTYGETLYYLEEQWKDELARRFSVFTLITTSSLLGGVGVPLMLLGRLRRRLQRRRRYRCWEEEERLTAAFRRPTYPGRGLGEGEPPAEGDGPTDQTGG